MVGLFTEARAEELLDTAPVFVGCLVAALVLAAELLHVLRWKPVSALAFGPGRRPVLWTWLVIPLRAAATGAIAWGCTVLMLLPSRTLEAAELEIGEHKHILLVLDVSPSMRLQDAGPEADQSRMARAREVMESFFKRVPMSQYRCSVIAFYNGAKPVVQDTVDLEVVRNILGDLPMHHAFKSGDTNLFAGLAAAAKLAQPWNPRSTTVIVISDGDTIAATGMPKMPASVRDVLVVGVGDPSSGTFINGKQSKQETGELRQLAARLRGEYHNGNTRHLSSSLIKALTKAEVKSLWEKLTLREWAMIAVGVGSLIYALLPLLLDVFGTRWRPGVRSGFAAA